MSYWTDITVIIAAYLLGSVSFAIVVARMLHLSDPRRVGSGNPGATNVMRAGGRKAGILTFAGDFLKAVPAVLFAVRFGSSEWVVALAGLAVFLGHLFPLYHRFHGGKGIATLFGCAMTWDWQIALLMAAAWLVLLGVFRYVSVSSMSAAAAAPILTWVLTQSQVLTLSMVLMAVLAVLRHRDNIRRLLSGAENKVGTA